MLENEMKDRIRKLLSGNRVYWAIAIPAVLIISSMPSSVVCRCYVGGTKSLVWSIGMLMILLRLVVGLCIGERRLKIIPYLVLPLVISWLIDKLATEHMCN